MALPIYESILIAKLNKIIPKSGRVLCLGYPSIKFQLREFKSLLKSLNIDSGFLSSQENYDHEKFFKDMGCNQIDVMDVDDYEGASLIYDLNMTIEDNELAGRYDLIIDPGTTEHVFNIPNLLKNIHYLLKNNGMILHILPSNGYLDHGFYQISPTLLFDYYRSNNYVTENFSIVSKKPLYTQIMPYSFDLYRNLDKKVLSKEFNDSKLFGIFRKSASSTYDVIPKQSFYSLLHDDKSHHYKMSHKLEGKIFRGPLKHYFSYLQEQ